MGSLYPPIASQTSAGAGGSASWRSSARSSATTSTSGAESFDLAIDPIAGTKWTFDNLFAMEEEMARLLGRKAELVERASVEKSRNYIRRRHILATAEPVYVER